MREQVRRVYECLVEHAPEAAPLSDLYAALESHGFHQKAALYTAMCELRRELPPKYRLEKRHRSGSYKLIVEPHQESRP